MLETWGRAGRVVDVDVDMDMDMDMDGPVRSKFGQGVLCCGLILPFLPNGCR